MALVSIGCHQTTSSCDIASAIRKADETGERIACELSGGGEETLVVSPVIETGSGEGSESYHVVIE